MVHQTMNPSRAKAPKASSKITPMSVRTLLFCSSSTRTNCAAALILGALLALSGCGAPPLVREPAPGPALQEPAPASVPAASAPRERAVLQRERARWVAHDWSELPGWGEDRAAELWPALLQSCARPAPGWSTLCARAALQAPADDMEAQLFLMKHLQPYRVESLEGEALGLITGYYEPMLEARRAPQGSFRTPLHGPPPDLAQRRPYYTRQQIESDGELRARLKRHELAYVEDPLDALVLQIQGSGRLRLPDGRWLRLAFAGHNDQPYQSIGRSLIERGELRAGEASWPAIKDWARRNPQRVNELLWSNPRYVFFREEALPDPAQGPRGAQGVPLTPGRSIAVDRASIPYGTPVWLDTSEPLSSQPLRRLVMAQDTGSAITGAVRADYFWGWGSEAEAQAGRMKQPLRMWVLWPRS